MNSFGRGGAEKSTTAFMVYLAKTFENYEIIGVYFYNRNFGAHEVLENNKIKLYHLTQKGYIRKIKALVKIIKKEKPDIVHSVLFEANIVARFSKLFTNFILVESLVNRSYASNREFRNKTLRLKNDIIKWIDKSTAFFVNHFHCVSSSVQEHYEEVYNKKISCTLLRRGRKPAPDQKTDYTLGKQLNLFTIARQEYQKGLIYIFEAIHKSNLNIVLKIAGRGGDASEELHHYIKENKLESKIQFIGFRDDLKDFFLEADAYISGSFFEGSPGSVIEAMSYGLPLLLSDIPEHREIGIEGSNTIYFELKNIEEMSKLFKYIFLKEYNFQNLGLNSVQIFSDDYTEDKIYSGFDSMYKKLISESSTKS
jgi:glycosyltransferase involved in cell wall biosynthesis